MSIFSIIITGAVSLTSPFPEQTPEDQSIKTVVIARKSQTSIEVLFIYPDYLFKAEMQ